MEILYGIFVGIGWLLLISLLRSFTTLFHELGHALPSLLFTNEPVLVFVGTYGDTKDGFHLNFGQLQIFFKFNLFSWNMGMCAHKPVAGIWQNIIIVLGGPIASLLIAIPLMINMTNHHLDSLWIFLIAAFMVSAFVDFLINIIPSKRPLFSDGGSVMYNDGYTLYLLFSRFFLSNDYFDLEQLLAEKRMDDFFMKSTEILEKGRADKSIFDLIIHACLQEKEWNDAIRMFKMKNKIYPLSKNEFLEMGKTYQKINEHNHAIHCFNQYLYFHFDDPVPLTYRASSNIELNLFNDAIKDLNMALETMPQYYEAKILKGKAYLGLDNYPAAEKDLISVLNLGLERPDLFNLLGNLYDKKGDASQAEIYFRRAAELDNTPTSD